MTQLDDDLLTEILNQNQEYKTRRRFNFGLFKTKFGLNQYWFNKIVSWFGSNKMVLTGSLAVIFIVLIAVFSIDRFTIPTEIGSNQQSIQNQSFTSESGPSPTSSQATPVDLADNQDKSNSSNLPSQSSQAQEEQKLSKYSEKDLANKMQTLDQLPKDLKTNLNGRNGETIEFEYLAQTRVLKYKGKVVGNDGCYQLGDSKISLKDGKYILEYSLVREAGFCIQMLTDIPISGELKTDLTPEQIQNFQNLFGVKKIEN